MRCFYDALSGRGRLLDGVAKTYQLLRVCIGAFCQAISFDAFAKVS